MGTEFVARLRLSASAGACCIVLHWARLEPRELKLTRPPDADYKAMTIVGDHEGTLALIDLAATPGDDNA
jgi:hypothetical protein